MGRDKVAKEYRIYLRRIKQKAKNVVWQVDPMHGQYVQHQKTATKTP